MAKTETTGSRIRAICTCVPSERFDNLNDAKEFTQEEIRKVTAMAGIAARRVADDSTCSSDLCEVAANRVLEMTGWERDSIDALIMVTQSPDYFTPSTACLLQKRLNLSEQCAAFDVGLGCSGYPYGLWLANMMLKNNGLKRVLLLDGETAGRFADKGDRSVSLLFGDAGSATALEASEPSDGNKSTFVLYTDGGGYKDLIIEGGGFRDRFPEDPRKYYVSMNGANVFNFTIRRVPELIRETLELAKITLEDIDYYIFHQSNQFMIKHLMKKIGIPDRKAPLTLKEYGNTGGVSVPLTITLGELERPPDKTLRLLLLGYGTGLSWASALVDLGPDVQLDHVERKSQGGEPNADRSVG
ncbi:ketoacyl-ACP synthase III [bacterium]|nr:ketoacyl-ACP synthase III [bacterium]